MTPEKKRIAMSGAIVLAIMLLAAGVIASRMPMIWYDEQVFQLVSALKGEFQFAGVEPPSREGIYHNGHAYLSISGWKTGSKITVYGMTSPSDQNRLLERTQEIVQDKKMQDMFVEFFPSDPKTTEPLRKSRIRSARN